MPKRDRSNENWSLKRKRSSVEKIAPRVPSYVDFGIMSSRTSFSIRYDPISKLFDVRDALAVEKAVRSRTRRQFALGFWMPSNYGRGLTYLQMVQLTISNAFLKATSHPIV